MFLYFLFLLLVQCTHGVFCATENAARFPFLGRLPAQSLVRQKCLASENKPWFFKSYVQISCEDLEKKLEYSAQYPKCYAIDNSFRSVGRNVDAILRGTDLSKFEKQSSWDRLFAETKFREKWAINYLYMVIDYEASLYSYDDIAIVKRNMQYAARNPIAVKHYQSQITLLEHYEAWIAEHQEKMEALYAGENAVESSEAAAQETSAE